MRELQTSSHCRNLILYHLIFVCKYRRKCFLNQEFAEELKKQIIEISKKYDFEIDTIELDYAKPDHLHILVRSVPKLAPLQIVRILKQQTNKWAWDSYSGWLRKFFWRKHHLWTRGYFCGSVGNISAEQVQEYLERQGGHKLEKSI